MTTRKTLLAIARAAASAGGTGWCAGADDDLPVTG
jgi:hypothetical protein